MLFCKYCGKTLPDGTAVCPHCHRTQPGYAAAEFVAEGDDAQYEEAEFELEEAEYELEEPEAPSAASGPEPDHVIVSPKPPVQEPPKRTEPVKYTVEPQQQSAPQPKKASGLSIAAFVCSLTVILCGLGAILAIVDLAKGKNEPRKKGLSIAALVISGLVMLIAFIGNRFIKPDLLAPKEQTLNEISATGATSFSGKTVINTAKATVKAAVTTAKPTAKITARPTTKATATPTPDPKQRALSLAKSVAYDKYWGRQMMITYLQEQGFSEAEATYGADNSGIDWNKNVLTVSLSVIQKSGGSASMAYELLQTVGYTKEEATYAANHWDTIDFYQNAVNSAKEMLNTASYGRDDMLIYLRMLGYTADQADYAVNKLGLK